MSRYSDSFLLAASGPATQSRVRSPHGDNRRVLPSEGPQGATSPPKSTSALSADDIDEQIRWFFAQT